MKLLKRLLSFLLLLVIILSLVGLAAFGLLTLTFLCSPFIGFIVVCLCAVLAWEQSAPDAGDLPSTPHRDLTGTRDHRIP